MKVIITLNFVAITYGRVQFSRKNSRSFSGWNKPEKLWEFFLLLWELKLLRSTYLFRRDLKPFLFHSVYGHQDTDWLCDAPSVF